jgi:ribonuclease P protein component
VFELPKSEILRGKNLLDALFSEGSKLYEHPFKVVYSFSPSNVHEAPLKFGIVVPKRWFRKAHDRNSIKRHCREAFRLNNTHLKAALLQHERSLKFMLIFIGKEAMPSQEIHRKIILLLQRLTLQVHDKAAG